MTAEVIAIWDRFNTEIHRFLIKKTSNRADADDLLQDVFVKIIKNIDKIDKSENTKSYLFAIVKNTVNDYFRKKTYTPAYTEEAKFLTEEESEHLNETIAECCIKPFINKLPEKYRTALMLSELEGKSQKELAQKLDISYSGMKSRVQRGKAELKKLILSCCNYHSDIYGNLSEKSDKDCAC